MSDAANTDDVPSFQGKSDITDDENSFDEKSDTTNYEKSDAANDPVPQTGHIMSTSEELHSWMQQYAPGFLAEGRDFSSAVYKEMKRSLNAKKGNTVAVIIEPRGSVHDNLNLDCMRPLINSFFEISGAKKYTTVRVRHLFSEVLVLIGNYD